MRFDLIFVLESLKRRRNFFPIDNPDLETVTTHNQTLVRLRVGDDVKNDVDKNVENVDEDKSAKIDDNVALTVLIPGGKNNNLHFNSNLESTLYFIKAEKLFIVNGFILDFLNRNPFRVGLGKVRPVSQT